MTSKFPYFLLFIFLFFFQSCDNKERAKNIEERENQLLQKEKDFAQKKLEYKNLLRMRDSILTKKDSVIPVKAWPADISGFWTGKVICTESDCSDYVIGDQRTDTWEFSSDSLQMITKIINDNNLVRIYSGKLENGEAKLSFKTDSAAKKKVEMSVLLNDFTGSKMRGTRTVTVDNKCTAKFSVELVRTKSKKL